MIIAATVALVLLMLLTVFQLALIVGAPLGNYAWGGQHKILPVKLRISSIASVIIYAILAIFIMSKSGIWILVSDETIIEPGLWIITAYLAFGVFLNAFSRSKYERNLMTPVAFVLALAFLVVAMA